MPLFRLEASKSINIREGEEYRSMKQKDNLQDNSEKKSTLSRIVSIGAILFSVFELWVNTIGTIPGIQRYAVFLGFLLFLIFLIYPLSKKGKKIGAVGILLAVTEAATGLYILFFQVNLHIERGIHSLYLRICPCGHNGHPGTDRCMEDHRIPVAAIVFLLYALFGRYFPLAIAGYFKRTVHLFERVLFFGCSLPLIKRVY